MVFLDNMAALKTLPSSAFRRRRVHFRHPRTKWEEAHDAMTPNTPIVPDDEQPPTAGSHMKWQRPRRPAETRWRALEALSTAVALVLAACAVPPAHHFLPPANAPLVRVLSLSPAALQDRLDHPPNRMEALTPTSGITRLTSKQSCSTTTRRSKRKPPPTLLRSRIQFGLNFCPPPGLP